MKIIVRISILLVSVALNPALAAEKETAVTAVVNPQETKPAEGIQKDYYSKEEVQALTAVIEKRSEKLENELKVKEQYLHALQTQIEAHLSRIEDVNLQIAEYMNMKDGQEKTKLKKLAEFYESMDFDQAVLLIEGLSDDLIIKIFDRMASKRAAKLLAELPPERAVKISANFSHIKIKKAN
jgi:flagellar motility protein MotE (MotC chaperone)